MGGNVNKSVMRYLAEGAAAPLDGRVVAVWEQLHGIVDRWKEAEHRFTGCRRI